MKYCYCVIIYIMAWIAGGCSNREPEQIIGSFTTYTGVIAEKNSLTPLSGVHVIITDGYNIYSESTTNNAGQFTLEMAHNANLQPTYIFIDGNGIYPSKKVDLIYTAECKYDYGLIFLYDQTDESFFPEIKNVSWDYMCDNGSMYFHDISIDSSCTLKDVYIELARSSSLHESTKYKLERHDDDKFYGVVNNLVIGEKYYFQVVATNTIGTSKSELYSRTFGLAIPVILGIKSATINSAIISFEIIEEPQKTLSSGICWSTSPDPTIDAFSTTASTASIMEAEMVDLDFAKSTYYVRAFAENANGISYSDILEMPVNNPYRLPTFKSGDYTYVCKYMGKADWYTAYNSCQSLVYVFDDWELPNIGYVSDFINGYYNSSDEPLSLPLWLARRYDFMEEGESETFLLTDNGLVMWSKNSSHHYYAVRKFVEN